MNKLFLLTITILITGIEVNSQEWGNPFMTVYKSSQIGGHAQNWAFQEDDRGVMYVGNGYGVLEFDGTRWRLIRNPNSSFAKSFGKDSTGRIYVGASAELGYLEPDVKGAMRYVSLLGLLKPEDRGFSYVWETVPTWRLTGSRARRAAPVQYAVAVHGAVSGPERNLFAGNTK